MGITISMRGGDMNKKVYDPDQDGKFDSDEIHITGAKGLMSRPTYDAGGNDKIDDDKIDAIRCLTENGFRSNPATGTVTNPAYINDSATVASISADTAMKYAEIDMKDNVLIYQYRFYGNSVNNVGDRAILEYWDAGLGSWVAWRTDIAALNVDAWSSWVWVSKIATSKIRWRFTTIVGALSYLRELEIKA